MIQLSAQLNEIIIDEKPTGLRLLQKPNGTVIHTLHGEYKELEMPHRRYLHTVLEPLGEKAGLNQLESDLRKMGVV